ncbi:hypothetical protein GCM10020220_033460 [Nonomuraea rubra]
MRPSDPTITGTATSSACWAADRPRDSLKRGPSGLSSAQAQKFTAKPSVARASITAGRRPVGERFVMSSSQGLREVVGPALGGMPVPPSPSRVWKSSTAARTPSAVRGVQRPASARW